MLENAFDAFEDSLLAATPLTLKALGMSEEFLGKGSLGVLTLASVENKSPLFTEVISSSPERASAFVRTCMKVIPDNNYVNALTEPNLKLESLRGRGKVIVVTGAGLSPSITDTIYQLYLDKNAQVGFLGVLRNGDPIANLSGHLVIDLG